MIVVNNHEELLGAIRSILALEIMGKTCIGYQSIPLSTSTVKTLTIPQTAVTAEVTVEINDANTPHAVGARYTLNGTIPQTGNTSDKTGVPLGDGDTLEIRGGNNLSSFQIIDSGNGSNTRYLKVQYFR